LFDATYQNPQVGDFGVFIENNFANNFENNLMINTRYS